MVILFLVRKETGNEAGQQDEQEGGSQEEDDRRRSEGSDIRGPQRPGRQSEQTWVTLNKRLRQPLVTHKETMLGVPEVPRSFPQ